MTNGEKIKEIFPNEEMYEQTPTMTYYGMMRFDTDWWNAEYKEPTTKNDCAEQNGCITCSLDDGDDCCRKLFEESMQEPTTKINCDNTDCNNCVNHKYCDYEIIKKYEDTTWIVGNDNVQIAVRNMPVDMMQKICAIIGSNKNDLPHCQYTDEEIAKSFIEDVEAVKDQLPTTKNDLGVDCISRAQTQTEIEMNASRYTIARERCGMGQVEWSDQLIKVSDAVDIIRNMPPVTPIRPKGHWISHGEHCRNLGVMPSGLGAYEWCSNCDCGIDVREWHRSRYNYCPNCGSDNREVEE